VRSGETALVTGATGSIGPRLVIALIRRGYRVRVLVRRADPGGFSPSVEVFEGRLEDREVLRRATRGADVVFHLAAKLHIVNPTVEQRGEYWSVNVDGTRTLVEAAEHVGIRRFVFFSTIAVYGKSRTGLVFDETSPIGPDSWYSETKAEGEQIVLAKVPAVVLRLAAVYGPSMKGNYPRLVRALARGFFVPIGNGTNRRTVVHEEDVVVAAVIAAEHPTAAGRVYNVTDGHVHSLNAVIAAVCAALGRRPPKAYVPASLAYVMAGIVEDVWRLGGRRTPIGRATIEKLLEDVAVLGNRVQQELAFSPQMDLLGGWNETVAELRRRGAIRSLFARIPPTSISP
jgi:UDP-glucose 4-epimerase